MTVWDRKPASTDVATYFHASVQAQALKHSAARVRAAGRTATRSESNDSSRENSMPSVKAELSDPKSLRGTAIGSSKESAAHARLQRRGTLATSLREPSPRGAGVPSLRRLNTAFASSAAHQEPDSWSLTSGEDDASSGNTPRHARNQAGTNSFSRSRNASNQGKGGISKAFALLGHSEGSLGAYREKDNAGADSSDESDSEGAEMARAITRGEAAEAAGREGFSAVTAMKQRQEQAQGVLDKMNRRLDRKNAMPSSGTSKKSGGAESDSSDLSADEVDSDSSSGSSSEIDAG